MNAFTTCSPVAVFILALPAFFADSLRAAPLLIDNFSTDLPAITSDDQLDGTMLGGEADFQFDSGLAGSFAISGGTGELSGVSNSGYLRINYDGEDNDSSDITYGLSPVDLTDGGANDRLAIDLTSVSGAINISIRVGNGPGHYSTWSIFGVEDPGILECTFDSFNTPPGYTDADFAAAELVWLQVAGVDPGEGFVIDSFMARDATIPGEDDPVPAVSAADTTPPVLKLLKKKKLKTPRPRHRIKGLAQDNDAVARVEVKSRGKGWRKAKLRTDGRWKFKTPRLESGRNKFKVRAEDASGNRSRVKKVKATGK